MPVVIVHPPDCKCGRHADCEMCLDSGYVSTWWDSRGFHGTPCKCQLGRKIASGAEPKASTAPGAGGAGGDQ